MKFAQIVSTEAEAVFANVLNVQAVTADDGDVVAWDVTSPDGVRVTQPATATLGLAVGIVSGSIAASAYGLAQVYGYKSVGNYSTDTATGAAGDGLIATAAADYLSNNAATGVSAAVAAGGSHPFFYAAETRTDTAALAATKVFIRCL